VPPIIIISLGHYSRQPAASYIDTAATEAGTVADMAATRKTDKYSTLSSAYRFEPTAIENHGVFSSTTPNFISELCGRICVHTGDARETSYLFQRMSIMLQRFNSVLFYDTLPVDLPDLVFNPSDLYCPGYKKIIKTTTMFMVLSS